MDWQLKDCYSFQGIKPFLLKLYWDKIHVRIDFLKIDINSCHDMNYSALHY